MNKDEAFAIFASRRRELDEYGVRSLAIFGSVARNEAGPESDVDILVEFNRPIGLFEFAGLQGYLEEILGRPVDLVTRDALHPLLKERILQEAVLAR